MLRWRGRVCGAYKASLTSRRPESQRSGGPRSNIKDSCKVAISALRDVAGRVSGYLRVSFCGIWLATASGLPASAAVQQRSKSVRRQRHRAATSRQQPKTRVARQPAPHQQSQQSTMAETVFAMVQRQEQERREAIARGEPDPLPRQRTGRARARAESVRTIRGVDGHGLGVRSLLLGRRSRKA